MFKEHFLIKRYFLSIITLLIVYYIDKFPIINIEMVTKLMIHIVLIVKITGIPLLNPVSGLIPLRLHWQTQAIIPLMFFLPGQNCLHVLISYHNDEG